MIDIVKYIKVNTKLLLANCIWLGIDIKTKTNNIIPICIIFCFPKENKIFPQILSQLSIKLKSTNWWFCNFSCSAILIFGIWSISPIFFSSFRSKNFRAVESLVSKTKKQKIMLIWRKISWCVRLFFLPS